MSYSSSSEAIEALAAEIGDNIYIDIANWRLYLREAHLHTPLAEQLYPMLQSGVPSEADLKNLLKQTKVKLGGGKLEIALADLVPAPVQADFYRLLESFAENL